MQVDFPGDWLDECGSTNTELQMRAQGGAPHGAWVAANHQTAGRGRAGSSWVSEQGNLFLSILVRELPQRELWTWVPLISALAARSAILALRPELQPTLKVKWPNDLWLNHSKCCGILCEGFGSNDQSYIIAGIGLNALQAPALQGREVACVGISPQELQPLIVKELLRRVASAHRPQLINEWRECSEFPLGARVQWSEKLGDRILGQGRVAGLGEYGELQVVLEDGTIKSLFSEEVSLRAAAEASGGSLL